MLVDVAAGVLVGAVVDVAVGWAVGSSVGSNGGGVVTVGSIVGLQVGLSVGSAASVACSNCGGVSDGWSGVAVGANAMTLLGPAVVGEGLIACCDHDAVAGGLHAFIDQGDDSR